VTVNVDYINITINDVYTTITSKGLLGYNAVGQVAGLGFEYRLPSAQALLYEMSLMIGTSSTQVSDMFRNGTTPGGDADFGSVIRAAQITPSVVSDFDVDGKFNDAPATINAPVEVHHNAYAWSAAPYRKFVIVKYEIKNTGSSALNNLYAGILADWDVPNADASKNKAAYDATNKMGYVWNTVTSGPYAAIKLLSNTAPAVHYALDNAPGGVGGVNVYSDFTTAEKYTVLSTNRPTAGDTSAQGNDVMDCVSSGPFTVNAGSSITVAFALIGGDNLVDIQASACAAQAKYDNGCVVGVNDVETNNFWMYNYPNPSTGSFNINYNVIGYDKAAIRIMNALGQTVMIFDNLAQGKNTLAVDGSALAAGYYFYQLKAGEAVLTKKITIVK
ncbi:MAG: T9SS type A sorting domain-containing protein, partial [Bacteroidetes bacterium]